MHVEQIMTRDVVACRAGQTVSEVIALLKETGVRMIPVVGEDGKILGAVNTLTLLSALVPEYIVGGDLKSISYVPDIGLLRRHYREMLDREIGEVMNGDPTIVKPDESLLSVAAALITYDRFEDALVAGSDGKLQGLVSASDILNCLNKLKPEEVIDA